MNAAEIRRVIPHHAATFDRVRAVSARERAEGRSARAVWAAYKEELRPLVAARRAELVEVEEVARREAHGILGCTESEADSAAARATGARIATWPPADRALWQLWRAVRSYAVLGNAELSDCTFPVPERARR
jgi:hypothetical protein